MRYKGVGCTTERADQGLPSNPGALDTIWFARVEFAQKRHSTSERGMTSGTSSPVITHERVIGSLRSSMPLKENTTDSPRQLSREITFNDHKCLVRAFAIIRE